MNPSGVTLRPVCDDDIDLLFRIFKSVNEPTFAALEMPSASFTGKGTYRAPGWEDAIGNHDFTVYVEDHGKPGADADRIWVEVLDKSDLVVSGLLIAPPATDNAEVIDGGNIVVPHTNSGSKK